MRLLLDTHVLLWWVHDSSRLRADTRATIGDPANELLWSAASTWELGIKLQLGKLRLEEPLQTFVSRMLRSQALTPLAVQHEHAVRVAELPPIHRDPFDRMLVAQSLVETVPLLTADVQLQAYGVQCVPA